MNIDALQIPAHARLAIETHALQAYPAECCGILVGLHGHVIRAVPAKNIAEPTRLHDRYLVDPLTILQTDKAAREENLEIIGFYHSHPDHPPTPSATDLQTAWTTYVYLIVPVSSQGVGPMQAWHLIDAHHMTPIHISSTPTNF